jgi:hypothetical protein
MGTPPSLAPFFASSRAATKPASVADILDEWLEVWSNLLEIKVTIARGLSSQWCLLYWLIFALSVTQTKLSADLSGDTIPFSSFSYRHHITVKYTGDSSLCLQHHANSNVHSRYM